MYVNDELVKDLIVPDGVTSIAPCLFYNCKIESVIFPDSVKAIGTDAFWNTNISSVKLPQYLEYLSGFNGTEITSVEIPSTVKEIGIRAFTELSLTNVTIPNSVTNIGEQAFSGCHQLTNIIIPNSVTNIGMSAFFDCDGLTSVTIPNSVKTIGNYAFSYCALTSITLPEGIEEIGNYAFDMDSLVIETLTLPNSLKKIGYLGYYINNKIKTIYVGDSLESLSSLNLSGISNLEQVTIGDKNSYFSSFNGCVYTKDFSTLLWCPQNTTTLELPEGLKTISSGVFSSLNLQSIVIPSTVTYIASNAFNSNIESIIVSAENTKYDSRNNCNAIIRTDTNALVVGCKNTIIPNSVTSIGQQAFSNCTGLTSITIPDSVTSIGQQAFSNCTGLTSITIPDSVTSIEYGTFEDCTSLQSVLGGAKVETIGNCAFSDCSQLASIIDLTQIKELGYNAFARCNSLPSNIYLTSLDYNDDSFHYFSFGSGAFRNCTSITSVKTSYFKADMFDGCSSLTTLEFTDDCSYFNFSGIQWASAPALQNIEQFVIPKNVKLVTNTYALSGTGINLVVSDIRNYCENSTWGGYSGSNSISILYNGEQITALEIPEGTEKLGSGFNACQTITSVHIPTSVTEIESRAFDCCNNLTSVQYDGTMADWLKVDVSSNSFASGLTITCTDGTVTTK